MPEPEPQSDLTMHLRMILGATLVILAGATAGRAQSDPPPPLALASYTFEGTGDDVTGVSPSMTLSNTPFVDGTLFLNGIDGLLDPTGYLALAPVPGLSYESFTFRLEFKQSVTAEPIVNLISGGPTYRWLGLSIEFGILSLRLQLTDFNWLFQFPGAPLVTNEWNQLILSLDARAGRLILLLNGLKLREVQLTPGFQFNVVGTPNAESDKVFNFNNYGNGASFHGWIDNFKIYGQALSESEIQRLLLPRLNLAPAGQQLLASWPGDLTGYRLQNNPGPWPPSQWLTFPVLPQSSNSVQFLLLEPTNQLQFYRLARP